MNEKVTQIAKTFYVAEGGKGIELSYLEWNELEAILNKIGA